MQCIVCYNTGVAVMLNSHKYGRCWHAHTHEQSWFNKRPMKTTVPVQQQQRHTCRLNWSYGKHAGKNNTHCTELATTYASCPNPPMAEERCPSAAPSHQ